jgi:hypothetical protein
MTNARTEPLDAFAQFIALIKSVFDRYCLDRTRFLQPPRPRHPSRRAGSREVSGEIKARNPAAISAPRASISILSIQWIAQTLLALQSR